jgi:hypothetical protein
MKILTKLIASARNFWGTPESPVISLPVAPPVSVKNISIKNDFQKKFYGPVDSPFRKSIMALKSGETILIECPRRDLDHRAKLIWGLANRIKRRHPDIKILANKTAKGIYVTKLAATAPVQKAGVLPQEQPNPAAVKVETNVALPLYRGKYPIKDMGVGHSFFIPCTVEESKLRRSYFRKRFHALGMKSCGRRITVNGVEGIRIWRIA